MKRDFPWVDACHENSCYISQVPFHCFESKDTDESDKKNLKLTISNCRLGLAPISSEVNRVSSEVSFRVLGLRVSRNQVVFCCCGEPTYQLAKVGPDYRGPGWHPMGLCTACLHHWNIWNLKVFEETNLYLCEKNSIGILLWPWSLRALLMSLCTAQYSVSISICQSLFIVIPGYGLGKAPSSSSWGIRVGRQSEE